MAGDDIPGVDELFALPPDEFTAARDALAKQLRAAKERAAAAEVKGLRRPTVAAWALNQLARHHPDEVAGLVGCGEALAAAQQAALAGDGTALRAATRARSAALRQVSALADEILGSRGGEAHRSEVVATLTAASSDPDAGAALLRGRLSEALPSATGFTFGLAPDLPAPDREAPGDERAAEPTPRRRSGRAERAGEGATAARAAEAAATAERTARTRRDEAGEARRAAGEAHAAAAEAEARVRELEDALAAARQGAAAAADRADDLEARARKAERAAGLAEEEAARLRS